MVRKWTCPRCNREGITTSTRSPKCSDCGVKLSRRYCRKLACVACDLSWSIEGRLCIRHRNQWFPHSGRILEESCRLDWGVNRPNVDFVDKFEFLNAILRPSARSRIRSCQEKKSFRTDFSTIGRFMGFGLWPVVMAKTDSFFIRSTKDLGNTNTYHEKSIDLGAFVDALGKSVLRIHNIEVVYSDNTGRSNQIQATDVGVAQFQLMTQTQTDIVLASNKSVIATGKLHAFNQLAAGSLATEVSTDIDFGPQHWTNGYLVGVEQIYFGLRVEVVIPSRLQRGHVHFLTITNHLFECGY